MGCGDKIKNSCGKKIYSTCVYYEGDLPEWSELLEEGCVVVEENIEELYNKTTELLELINVEDFESGCEKLTIQLEGGKITLRSLLLTYQEALETLLCNNDQPLNDINISDWGIDLSCFSDVCDAPITKLSQLLKELADRECSGCVDMMVVTSSTTLTKVPELLVIKSSGSAVNVTLPASFCKLLKVKMKGNSNGSSLVNTIDGVLGYTLSNNEVVEIVQDETSLITI